MDKAKVKKLIISLIAVFIIVYVLYVFITSVFDVDGIDTEIATRLTATDSFYKDGIIIRDETLIKDNNNGSISYICNDGVSVKKNEIIAKWYDNEEDVLNNQKIEEIQQEINRLNKLKLSATNGDLGIDTIDSRISNSIREFNSNIADKDFINTNTYLDNLTYLVTQRLIVTGKSVDIENRIEDLTAQKNELNSGSNNAVANVKAKIAGCFVSSVDGYESVYDYNSVTDINYEQYSKIKSEQPKKIAKNTIGKIIGNVNWYIVCPISESEMLKLTTKSFNNVIIKMPFASADSLPGTIEAINKSSDGKDSILIIRCDYMNSDLAKIRNENIEICLNTYEGIRVSKSALHDDYVTKITEDENGNEIKEKKKVQGVYVLYGNELQFKEVSIIYSGSDFVICDPAPENDVLFNGKTVSLYDNVVINGSDLKDGKVIN
ncbi:MAG: hypothetical protein J1F17_05435 [Oscillospiraceae bacterium]|nr:hypothetical protein [Oscillospiraceae bacterium]